MPPFLQYCRLTFAIDYRTLGTNRYHKLLRKHNPLKGNPPTATYDHKQVFADYSSGNITPEMAVGHSLQHINQLYEAQSAANAERRAQQAKVDTLDKCVNSMQAALDRLTAFMEKVLHTQKRKSSGEQPKA